MAPKCFPSAVFKWTSATSKKSSVYLQNNSDFDSSHKIYCNSRKEASVFFLILISGILCSSKNNLKIKIHNGHLTHIYALRGYIFPLGGCNITVFPPLHTYSEFNKPQK